MLSFHQIAQNSREGDDSMRSRAWELEFYVYLSKTRHRTEGRKHLTYQPPSKQNFPNVAWICASDSAARSV